MNKEIETRADAANEAILECGSKLPNGRVMRPFSWGSMSACRKMGLTLFTGDQKRADLSGIEQLDQIFSLVWFQTTDPKFAREAIKDGTWEELVEELKDDLPVDSLNGIMDELETLSKQIGLLSVSVKNKPGEKSGNEDAPGN